MKKFVIIGISDAADPEFTSEVRHVIAANRLFSGGRRHHAIVSRLLPEGSQWIDITAPLDGVFRQYEEHAEADTIVVFASGDPLFFGFANTVLRKCPDAEIKLYPYFNSLQMLAHRLVMPYQDMHVVSLTGRPWPEFDKALINRTSMIGVLTDKEHTPAAIAARMLDYGYSWYTMHVGENLGNADERISTLTLQEAAARTFLNPNCLILRATDGMRPKPFGIPDDAFELLDGRERMITKMPIRLLSLQAMELERRSAMWDVGFCTGSVSIEARLLFPHLSITSFEIREEGRHLMDVNSRRFGAPGINALIGDFLEADVSRLQQPDAVFIGGHGGHLPEIMRKVHSVLRPGGCIVMNAVTVPSTSPVAALPSSREAFEQTALELGMQLHEPEHIALNDYHPIDILKATLL